MPESHTSYWDTMSTDESNNSDFQDPAVVPESTTPPFEYFSQTKRRVEGEARRQALAKWLRRFWGAACIAGGAVLGTVGLGIITGSPKAEIIVQATAVAICGLIAGPVFVLLSYWGLVAAIAMSEARAEVLWGRSNVDVVGSGAFGRFLRRPWPVLRFLVYVCP